MRVNGREVMTTGREGVGRFRWPRVHTAECEEKKKGAGD